MVVVAFARLCRLSHASSGSKNIERPRLMTRPRSMSPMVLRFAAPAMPVDQPVDGGFESNRNRHEDAGSEPVIRGADPFD